MAPGSGGSSNSPGSPTNHNYLVGRAGTSTIDPGMTVVVDGTGVAFTPFSTYSYKVAQLTGDESGMKRRRLATVACFCLRANGGAFAPPSSGIVQGQHSGRLLGEIRR